MCTSVDTDQSDVITCRQGSENPRLELGEERKFHFLEDFTWWAFYNHSLEHSVLSERVIRPSVSKFQWRWMLYPETSNLNKQHSWACLNTAECSVGRQTTLMAYCRSAKQFMISCGPQSSVIWPRRHQAYQFYLLHGKLWVQGTWDFVGKHSWSFPFCTIYCF